MEEATTQEVSGPAKKSAPAICIAGASGAGKTTAIIEAAPAIRAAGLRLVVACYDTGSRQAYDCAGVELAKLKPIQDLMDEYPENEAVLVLDAWKPYEEWTVGQFKRKHRKDAPTIKDWSVIAGGWHDDIAAFYQRFNAIMVIHISTGSTPIQTTDADGKPTTVILPPGAVICTKSLNAHGPKLVMSAPIVLPLSSGGETGVRCWAQRVGGREGQAQKKFMRRLSDGTVSYALPNASAEDKTVPVSVCSLGDIWTSLLR